MDTIAGELGLLILLSAAVFLPGSAILVVSGGWRRWSGLQRYVVAAGLGLAFYPIVFYTTRALLPHAWLDRWLLVGLLLVALLITIWGSWKERIFLFRPERLEWVALLMLGLTLASRIWFGHDYPFPAWSDSLHHTLLTDLTAESGRLPRTLAPYFPNVLDMYHLGLYSLSGTLQIISQAPAHEALLWTTQFLNGLCGIGIYLVLDRYSGRRGAILGLALAGLISAHPALWANWGRFTQLSSVVLLPIAWVFFLELIMPRAPSAEKKTGPGQQSWLIFFAAATGAAVFLYHFRVGIFYILLLGVTALVTWVLVRSRANLHLTLRALLATGLGMLIIILPVLWAAADAYLATRVTSAGTLTPGQQEQILQNYYAFPLSSLPYLAAPVWLLVITALAGLAGLITRNVLILIALLWALLLVLVGNLYLLEIPALSFTNLGAILIMLYIPISVILGAALEEGFCRLPQKLLGRATTIVVVAILGAGLLAAWSRAKTVEPHRHFVTGQDVAAMQWIDENIPADATFAINTYQWLPGAIHGTDAGYWIPYFTGRQIVTMSMLGDGLTGEYRRQTLARAEAAEALESDLGALDALRDLGVEYIYIGVTGDFSGPGLQLDLLTQSDAVKVLYTQGDTAVLQILPPAAQ